MAASDSSCFRPLFPKAVVQVHLAVPAEVRQRVSPLLAAQRSGNPAEGCVQCNSAIHCSPHAATEDEQHCRKAGHRKLSLERRARPHEE